MKPRLPADVEPWRTLSVTKLRILERAQQPARWMDLLNFTMITRRALFEHINRLKEQKMIRKDRGTGLYSLTEKGRKELVEGRELLERARVLAWAEEHLDEVRRIMKRSPVRARPRLPK